MKKNAVFIAFIVLALRAICQSEDFNQLPALTWKFNAANAFVSAPVIDKGIVFIGSTDSNMYAIDINSGNIKWKFKSGGQIRSTACISNDKLYFVCGTGLCCVNKLDGKLLYNFKTGGEKQYDVYDYFQSTPVINNGKLFFGSSDSCIYALDLESQVLIWKYKTEGIVHNTFAFGKGMVFAGSYDGNVYAIHIESGKLAWKFKSLGHDFFAKGEMQFSPTYANNRVYIGGRDYNLYALDAEKGFSHWNRAFPEGWVTSVTLSPRTDSVLLVGTSDPRILLCVDGIYGQDIWKADLKSNMFDKCTTTKGMLYAGLGNGKLCGIDRKTGKIEWVYATESYTANRLQYLKEDDNDRDDIGSILKTGEDYITLEKKLGGIFSRPAIYDNYMVFASMNGSVYCLKK
jgi:outer membrane protein assembly factor BamB